ncbi:MAG: hypothetical protein ABMA01_10465 [Chthoniobacteraceae bacterium]
MILILWLANIVAVMACQVPVFRYALERWAPAEYLVSITPSEAGLTDAEKKAVELLRAAPRDSATPVNLEIEIGQPAPGSHGPAQFTLHYPHKLRDTRKPPVWQAALTAQNVQRLIDSPVRRELRQRLLTGESAIWLLVESGDTAKDEAAASTLTAALANAQSSLKLPDGVITSADAAKRTGPKANEQADALRSDLPLKIEFSVLRLRRADPEESALLAMLTHLEDDLGGFAGEPMVFPAFGRGRVLEPLIGAGINKDNVMEHSGDLCGACSCEVKDLNPGIDLLITANWEPVDTTPKIEIIRITPQAETTAVRQPPILAVLAGVIALVVAALLFRRKPRPH